MVLSLVGAGAASAQSDKDKAVRVSPEQLSASFAEVARRVEPAVVSIDTKGRIPETAARGSATPGDSDDVMDFFRRQLPRRPSYSIGSGFIVDKAGYIITNEHVIDDSVKITVKLTSGEEYPARVIGIDDETDLAVIKIDAGHDLPFVKLGNSDEVRVGDWVLALGSPFGLTRTVTAGIISQTKRETPSTSVFQRFIQTDAAINRGNSGGPLVNMDGEVIGINSQIATSTGDYNGVGFALPSSEAKIVFEQIVKNGKVKRGYLGVNLDSVKSEFAAVYGLKEPKGAIVTDVRDSTAAARAGLQQGDVIIELNGQPIDNAQDLIAKVSATQPDQPVSMLILRENGSNLERKTTTIRLGERPPSKPAEDNNGPTKLSLDRSKEEPKPFGLTLAELTPSLAASYKIQGQRGLVVKEINPESFIADIKAVDGDDALTEGDVIQRINRVPVSDTKAFADTVSKLKKGDPVVLHVLAVRRSPRGPQLKIVQFTVQ
jgi:serine protease Do